MHDENPEEFPKFQIPESFLEKLFEFTGSSFDQSKGYLIAYVNQEGSPVVFCKAGSQIVEMGIRKALEKYLMDIEGADSPFDINGDNS